MSASLEDRWLKVFQPRPEAALRLVCFPYAGGGASVFRDWSGGLPASVEVQAVQLPGRENRFREVPFRAIEPLADEAARVLAARVAPPFAFFGHSLGAAVAFEVTRRLGRAGLELPVHLVVSGRSAPRTPCDEPPIHDLPSDEFFAALRRYDGTPEEVLQHRELMAMLEPILRGDFAVSETYEYAPDPEPLPVPITALGGVRDEDVPPEKLDAWAEETRAVFRRHLLDGGHFFVNERRAEVLAIVAQELSCHLQPARVR